MITLQDARRVIAAAEKKAEEIGQPMNIAVVDGGGNLVAHVRIVDFLPFRRPRCPLPYRTACDTYSI